MEREFKLSLEGLDCANCANKIEQKVNRLEEIEEANVNFSMGRMNVTMKEELNKEDVIGKITKIVKELEPDVNVKELEPDVLVSEDEEKHVHCHDGACSCHGDHSHETEEKSGILGFIKENILLIIGIV